MLTNLKIEEKDLPEHIIVCGDPFRAEYIASLLGDSRVLAKSREYHSFAGSWKGVSVGVVSHGVGAPGAAVCFEELAMGGAKTIIRVGTAGSYQKEITPGSLVISSSVVRCDGLTSQLVPVGFPAVANRKVIENLVDAAFALKCESVFEGMTLTLDAFYEGVMEFPHSLYKKAGVLAVEMENSALFVIASLRGFKAGSILAIDGYADANLREEYNPNREIVKKAIELEIVVALDALVKE